MEQQKPLETFENMNFGIQGSSFIPTEDLSDVIFGPDVTAEPSQVKPKETPTPPKKEVKEKVVEPVKETPVIEESINEDDVFNIEEEQEEEEVIEETPKETDTEDNTFAVLSEGLFELGIFQKEEDETPITTGEQLKERFEKELTSRTNNQIYNFVREKHGEGGVEAFNAIFVNGVSPEEYIAQYVNIESVKDMDITQEHNQEKIYRDYYKLQGFSDDKIAKRLQKTKDYGDLEEEVKDLHELLLKHEEAELQDLIEERAQFQEQKRQQRQLYYNNLSKIFTDKIKSKDFDGIPVTEKIAKDTFDYLYSEKHQLPDGTFLTDFDRDILELRRPENHEKRVKLALLLKSNLDLSKVKIKAVSEAQNSVFGNLKRQEKQIKKSNTTPINKSFFE